MFPSHLPFSWWPCFYFIEKSKPSKENFHKFPPCNCPLAETFPPNSRLVHLTANLTVHLPTATSKVTCAKRSSLYYFKTCFPHRLALSGNGNSIPPRLGQKPWSCPWVLSFSYNPHSISQKILLKYIQNLTPSHHPHHYHPSSVKT